MKTTYAALLAAGTGILGMAIGAVGAGVIVGIGAMAGGAIGGSMLGMCMTADAAINGGLLQPQQLEPLAKNLAQEVAKTLPTLREDVKTEDYKSALQKFGQGNQPTTNCDRLMQGVFTQLGR